jgi:CRISPR-associated protein Csb2
LQIDRPEKGGDSSRFFKDLPEGPTVARFDISGGQPPRMTSSLFLAERVHLALVDLSNGSSIFTGCDDSRKPLHGHGHAHIFCECDPRRDGKGEITSVIVYSRLGFGPQEREALQSLGRVWGPGGLEVELELQKMGGREEFAGCALLGENRNWVSHTPFLPTRHPKRTRAGALKVDDTGLQIGSPEHELRRLLRLAGFPNPVDVEPVAGTRLGGQDIPWHAFLRRREKGLGKPAANGAGYGFRIQFPEPVQGPVAVGYGAHFGMGGFRAGGARCIDL